MVIITLYNSKILLSLHYFLTPQSQTFTNLLIRIFGVSNPTFFMRFLRNYVSIIVGLISNNTVLQCCLLWIFVSIRRLLRFIVCIGSQPLNTEVDFDFADLCICVSLGAFSHFCYHEITFINRFVFAYMHSFLFDLSWHNHAKSYRLLFFFSLRGN